MQLCTKNERVNLTVSVINKSGLRILLLLLILLAFGRAMLWLDAKALWWDESLTLQRAESDWGALLRAQLMIDDNVAQWPTTDQHPFTFFVLVGILIRLAGDSEFVLRFPSVMAVTLLAPTAWCMARRLVRRTVLAESAPLWAAFVAAISPFYLWYGQEARPYALLTWLALLSTYLLLRAVEIETWPLLRRSGWFWGYLGVTAAFLTTHYYAGFLLPIHLLLIWRWLARHGERKALAWMAVLALLGAGLGGLAAWRVLSNSSGANFDEVPLSILLPDLLNAFNLGPSADIGVGWVWALDLLCGLIGLLGAIWTLRNWSTIRNGGWLLPAFVLVPIVMMRLTELIQPGYMNARHMSVAGGGWFLLLAGGLALVWRRQRVVALGLALLLTMGVSYSTYAYFFGHDYQKDDFAALGRFMGRRMLPGDLVLLNPSASWRIFHYYAPLEYIDEYNQTHDPADPNYRPTRYIGVPMIYGWDVTFDTLTEAKSIYRRIWLVTSGTQPYMDLEDRLEAWLFDNMYAVQEVTFFSHSSLKATLFTPQPPVFNSSSAVNVPVQKTPVEVVFGDLIRLTGYEAGEPLTPQSSIPVTLFWGIRQQTERHYRYILRLAEKLPDGQWRELAKTEREPYEGVIATAYWAPQQTIVEYTEFPPEPDRLPVDNEHELFILLQVYDAETFAKLPITEQQLSNLPGAAADPDGVTVILPFQ